MMCKTCNVAHAQHELYRDQCLTCVGKERDEFLEAFADLYQNGWPDLEEKTDERVAELKEAAKNRK